MYYLNLMTPCWVEIGIERKMFWSEKSFQNELRCTNDAELHRLIKFWTRKYRQRHTKKGFTWICSGKIKQILFWCNVWKLIILVSSSDEWDIAWFLSKASALVNYWAILQVIWYGMWWWMTESEILFVYFFFMMMILSNILYFHFRRNLPTKGFSRFAQNVIFELFTRKRLSYLHLIHQPC